MNDDKQKAAKAAKKDDKPKIMAAKREDPVNAADNWMGPENAMASLSTLRGDGKEQRGRSAGYGPR